nr:hypothetical protein [Escherichia coli]
MNHTKFFEPTQTSFHFIHHHFGKTISTDTFSLISSTILAYSNFGFPEHED